MRRTTALAVGALVCSMAVSVWAEEPKPKPAPPAKKVVKISVRDNGKGFSEKALSGLFTPFLTTKEEGSGLGLAIVRRIVEGLDGEVCGDNDPTGGAVVSITLPISPSDSVPLLQSQGIAVSS